MKTKGSNIAWKFANKLRGKYSDVNVITILITSVYIIWKANDRIGETDFSHLVKIASEEFGEDLDKEQYQVFKDALRILQEEMNDLFGDEYFELILNSNETKLRELLEFFVQKADKISNERKDFTNERIAALYSNILTGKSPNKVFDPCIGSGQLIVELARKNIINTTTSINGIEINSTASFIAHVNLCVNGFDNFSVSTGNILMQNLNDRSYDLIISDLPLGVRLRDRSLGGENIPAHWRFYHLLLQKCLQQLESYGDAYFTSSAHMIRNLNKYSKGHQEKLPIYNNGKNYSQYLSELIDASDSAGWSYTGIQLYLMGFKGTTEQDLEIKKIAASGKTANSSSIAKTVWFSYDYINDPSFFLSKTFNDILEAGKENLFRLDKFFVQSVVTNKKDLIEDKSNIVALSIKKMHNIAGWKKIDVDELQERYTRDDSDNENRDFNRRSYNLVEPGTWVLIPTKDGFHIVLLDVSNMVLIPKVLGAMKPKPHLSKFDIEWLRAILLSSFVQEQVKAIRGNSIGRTISSKGILENILVQPQTKLEKKEFVNSWKEKRIEELEQEQEKVRKDYQDVAKKEKTEALKEEFNLIHELHHTIKNDLSTIKGGIKSFEKYLRKKDLIDDTLNELRLGADPKLQDTVAERLNLIKNASRSISNLLDNYKKVLRFNPKNQNREWISLREFFEEYGNSYGQFNFEIKMNFAQNGPCKLLADPEVLHIVFNNIINNAKTHGFTDQNEVYSIVVELKEEAKYEGTIDFHDGNGPIPRPAGVGLAIIIKNDGDPILDETDEPTYFSRGSSKNQQGSGLGGFHIKKGVESMGGEVSILQPSEDDPYQTQIQLMFFDFDGIEYPRVQLKTFDPIGKSH